MPPVSSSPLPDMDEAELQRAFARILQDVANIKLKVQPLTRASPTEGKSKTTICGRGGPAVAGEDFLQVLEKRDVYTRLLVIIECMRTLVDHAMTKAANYHPRVKAFLNCAAGIVGTWIPNTTKYEALMKDFNFLSLTLNGMDRVAEKFDEVFPKLGFFGRIKLFVSSVASYLSELWRKLKVNWKTVAIIALVGVFVAVVVVTAVVVLCPPCAPVAAALGGSSATGATAAAAAGAGAGTGAAMAVEAAVVSVTAVEGGTTLGTALFATFAIMSV